MLGSGGTVVLVGLSPAGERPSSTAVAVREARPILVSHGGDHLPQEDFPASRSWALDGELDLAGDGHAHGAARRAGRTRSTRCGAAR